MQVRHIVVGRAVVLDGHGSAFRIVCEVHHCRVIVGGFHQLTAKVDIVVGIGSVGATDSQTVRIVGVCPGGAAIRDGSQFPSVFPLHRPPGAIVIAGGVTHAVVADGLTVVLRQQVAPGGIAVGIGDGVGGGAHGAGSVGIFLPGFDIATIVVGPDGSLAGGLVILPNQLVGRIVDIPCGMGAIADGEDVAVIIIGIGIGNIMVSVGGAAELGYQGGSLIGIGTEIGIILRQHMLAIAVGMLRVLLRDPAEGIVGIASSGIFLPDSGDPVIIIVGEVGIAGVSVDDFPDFGQIAVPFILYGTFHPTAREKAQESEDSWASSYNYGFG